MPYEMITIKVHFQYMNELNLVNTLIQILCDRDASYFYTRILQGIYIMKKNGRNI